MYSSPVLRQMNAEISQKEHVNVNENIANFVEAMHLESLSRVRTEPNEVESLSQEVAMQWETRR